MNYFESICGCLRNVPLSGEPADTITLCHDRVSLGCSFDFRQAMINRGISRFFGKLLNVFCEFIPQVLFLMCLFGYLCVLIFYKWVNFTAYEAGCAPSLLIGLINMFLLKYEPNPRNTDGSECKKNTFYGTQVRPPFADFNRLSSWFLYFVFLAKLSNVFGVAGPDLCTLDACDQTCYHVPAMESISEFYCSTHVRRIQVQVEKVYPRNYD